MKKCQKMPIYECEICDFKCSKYSNLQTHLSTRKHQNRTKLNKKMPKNADIIFTCKNCGKYYKARNSLWYHEQKCEVSKEPPISQELVKAILQQNKSLHQTLLTLSTNKPASINSSKTFNLNFFLNETCKNAMNISDFVSMIQPKIENLEETGRVGYVTGISNLILNQLNDMELDNRPVHCRDLKREILYVKDKNEWNKETPESPILINAIKVIAHKNIQTISEWQEKHPNCNDYNSRYNKEYLNIVSNAMAGSSTEEIHKNMGKIVSNIAKEMTIDK